MQLSLYLISYLMNTKMLHIQNIQNIVISKLSIIFAFLPRFDSLELHTVWVELEKLVPGTIEQNLRQFFAQMCCFWIPFEMLDPCSKRALYKDKMPPRNQ